MTDKLWIAVFLLQKVVNCLDFSSQNLSEINQDWINQMFNTQLLNFSGNSIEYLPKFYRLSGLRILDLSWNKIGRLESNVFQLNSFDILNISHNRIEFIHEQAFYKAIIYEIDLSYNLITSIPIFGWHGQHLINLNLNFNRLQQIKYEDFSGMNGLINLTISHSKLIYIHPFIFYLNNLKYLNLESNHLTTIENHHTIHKIGLTYLNLINNQWICDCKLSFLQTAYLTILKSSPIAKCSMPEIFQHKSLLEINLQSYCKISSGITFTEKILAAIIGGSFLIIIIGYFIYLLHKLRVQKNQEIFEANQRRRILNNNQLTFSSKTIETLV